jgi:uncharacterized membrane protein YuzA (DUF378 family)
MDEISDDDVLGLIDLPTLMIVLLGGLYLGLLGAFNVDFLQMFMGGMGARLVYAAIGLSALWQFSRQRFS